MQGTHKSDEPVLNMTRNSWGVFQCWCCWCRPTTGACGREVRTDLTAMLTPDSQSIASSVCPMSPEITFQLSHLTVTAQTGAWFNFFLLFSGLPGIWDFTFLTKNGTLPSFIGSVESSPLDHQGSPELHLSSSPGSSSRSRLSTPSPGGMPRLPRLHPLNSRLLSKPHRGPFHLTSIYSLTIALADLFILEEESRSSFKSINSKYSVRLLWHHTQIGAWQLLLVSFLDLQSLNFICLVFKLDL